MPTFLYAVDGEPQQTDQHVLTVRQILSNAGVNPVERYLIELRGKEQFPLHDLDAEVHISENEKFITAFIGPVPVA
jgi:hypothetical protein